MKYLLKITFYLLLVITAISCNKKPEIIYRLIELEKEPAIVRKITDLPAYIEADELFYLELVKEHNELRLTNLYFVNTLVEDGYLSKFPEQYKKEGMAVKISGSVVVCKSNTTKQVYGYCNDTNIINDTHLYDFGLRSIETDE